MPTITANQCEMFYEIDDFTDPWVKDKETVWLQHGVGRSTKFWYHWVPALARQYRVLRRDMRGHGQSADPGLEHRWSLDELVTDMREFMDAMGLQQVHYLGESIGGILGIIFATRWPERFKSLTICNSPTTIRPASTKAISGRHGSVDKMLTAGGSREWGRVMVEQRVLSGKNPDHIEWVVNEWGKTPAHILKGISHTLDGADTTPLLPQVTVPTLILAPTHSPLTPLSDQLSMRTLIPNARMTVIEGPSHETYVDEPEDCINAFLKFIKTVG
jgi:pimeloyl-ACP methyl ester carboxylesterase